MIPLRAEITGNACTAGGITVRSSSPVLALCRRLIEVGHDPAQPLHAYRGDVLALRVRSIGAGARLAVSGGGIGFSLDRAVDEGQPRPVPVYRDGAPEKTRPGRPEQGF